MQRARLLPWHAKLGTCTVVLPMSSRHRVRPPSWAAQIHAQMTIIRSPSPGFGGSAKLCYGLWRGGGGGGGSAVNVNGSNEMHTTKRDLWRQNSHACHVLHIFAKSVMQS